mmetsp:Transcript_24073/g.58724  ORF Transcript_24073/g.58724 Transcript_24073/m.58724 type:complete len:278 (-) Transcript_24073:44-877(-)
MSLVAGSVSLSSACTVSTSTMAACLAPSSSVRSLASMVGTTNDERENWPRRRRGSAVATSVVVVAPPAAPSLCQGTASSLSAGGNLTPLATRCSCRSLYMVSESGCSGPHERIRMSTRSCTSSLSVTASSSSSSLAAPPRAFDATFALSRWRFFTFLPASLVSRRATSSPHTARCTSTPQFLTTVSSRCSASSRCRCLGGSRCSTATMEVTTSSPSSSGCVFTTSTRFKLSCQSGTRRRKSVALFTISSSSARRRAAAFAAAGYTTTVVVIVVVTSS